MSEILSVQSQLSAYTKSMSPKAASGPASDSWFEAMAEAWGKALDKQAGTMIDQAANLSAGGETPAQVTMLTAESLRMQFLSNSSHTALSSMGSALETLARKQ